MKNKIELLAPAGGIKQFFAAVENGADAVYLGGYKFNARIKADNFTIEELAEAIKYAHLRNVKIYITVNTLLTDNELESAAEYCTELYNLGADAIIVQDLGLAGWVRKNLPDFPLHLSTQGTVYNLSGVNAAETLGISRVVLARETSLAEIKKITDSSSMEIEIFIHGALCMSYSGQCQMSRVIGGINGRSGNRGLCAQPCRLPYNPGNHENKYPLSPKDLCSLDFLSEIIDAGVTSLKIEGRMKSPEYVAVVTSIYRKYLDQLMSTGTYRIEKTDRDALRQIYSRGEFTSGYMFENPGSEILTENLPKHHGIYVGKIIKVHSNKKLIDIELTEPLSIGDGIEIRNKELTGNIVTYMEKIGKNIYRIGDIKGKVEAGQPVYRISQLSLMKDIRKTYEGANFADGKNYKRVPVDLELNLNLNNHPTLIITEGQDSFTYTDTDTLVESAINKPLEKATAERQLRKTGSTCFAVENILIHIEEKTTLPLSALNKLRRDGLDAYSQYKLDKQRRTQADVTNYSCIHTSGNQKESKSLAFYIFDPDELKTYDFKSKMDILNVEKARIYLPLQIFMEKFKLPDYLNPVPYISNISKGNLDEYIEKNFSAIVDAVKNTGIAIGNIGWCREFSAEDITIYADYGMNLNNECAKETVKSLGVSPTYMSLESQDDGGWPIMITEHPLPDKGFTDRKNQGYHVIKSTAGDKWLLFKTDGLKSHNKLIEKWKNSTGEFRIYI